MNARTLLTRSVLFHGRTHLAVVLGVAAGAASLTGALLVGDSMRGSLREIAVGRLGRIEHTALSPRFLRAELANEIDHASNADVKDILVAPALLLSGGVEHAATNARVNRVGVLGIDERFWALRSSGATIAPPSLGLLDAAINEPLAKELGANVGDDVLIRIGKPSAVSAETLLGRRDDRTVSLRLTVRSILPAEDLGAFNLNPRQQLPRNIFVSIAALQKALDRDGRANALLAGPAASATNGTPSALELTDRLRRSLTPVDLGLRVRADRPRGYVSIESEAMLIEDGLVRAISQVAEEEQLIPCPTLTYLANEIAVDRDHDGVAAPEQDRESPSQDRSAIPYSTVTALDSNGSTYQAFRLTTGEPAPPLESGEILLNEWAGNELRATPGDRITLTYYVTGRFGELSTAMATFRLRGILALNEAVADPGFTPEYRGVTDARNLSDWDPPFPMDLSRIRGQDEEYWDRLRATPKAFVTLADGQRLWATDEQRFGSVTSIRLIPREGDRGIEEIASRLSARLGLAGASASGMAFEATRARLLAASAGTTDFGLLFIGFSFFLIASSAMLVALLFRLSVERRSAEVGLLRAVGFDPRRVTKLLMAEGGMLAIGGCLIGLIGAVGYAALMLTGLRTLWSDAAHMPLLRLHVSVTSLFVGPAVGFLVAMGSIAWSVRGLSFLSIRSLLAGAVAAGRSWSGFARSRWAKPTAIVGFLFAILFMLLPLRMEGASAAPAFFGGGACMLISTMGLVAVSLRRDRFRVIAPDEPLAWSRLGVRNTRRRFGRSMMIAGLVASALFLIVALQAFRLEADSEPNDRRSGTGGFAVFAEAATPLLADLNTSGGRETVNIADADSDIFDGVSFVPFRLRPGDESSCLNLFRPSAPRVVGATDKFVSRGGFRFSAAMAENEIERANPWTLLHRHTNDGVIPVIADEAAVLWQWHSGLGKELRIEDEKGVTRRLRFVALLARSMLQDELIVSDENFQQLFPSIDGYGFFLIEAAADRLSALERTLESDLSDYGFDVAASIGRLNSYLAVQNTYLYTFQMLGGFGLILGTIGLAAVMLRNVWERRGELALFRALGFSRSSIGWLVLVENLALLTAGTAAGVLSALVAIAPHIASRASAIPWCTLALLLLGVLMTGTVTGLLAVIPTLRAPLISSLRSE